MRIAITGADGFVGKHATRVFRERGHDVLELVGGDPIGAQRKIDLRDAASLRNVLIGSNVSHVLHLAGASSVARSHENPGETFAINALGTVHLLDAVRHEASNARVVVVSSGEVYGNLDHPAREDDATKPTSPYAASKVAAEVSAKQFQTSYGLQIVVARPFNHIGPGQAPHFVIPSFARQLQEIKRTGKGELRVGNIDVVRDFSHVLDVVDAYEVVLERGAVGEVYNVGSGEGVTIRHLIARLSMLVDLEVEPTVDPSRARSIDLPSLVGDSSRLGSLGWRPSRSLGDALNAVLATTL